VFAILLIRRCLIECVLLYSTALSDPVFPQYCLQVVATDSLCQRHIVLWVRCIIVLCTKLFRNKCKNVIEIEVNNIETKRKNAMANIKLISTYMINYRVILV
jgi:hypothetical protein